MIRAYKYGFLFLLLLLMAAGGFAQKTGSITTANDHLILLLDLRENNTSLQGVLKNAGMANIDINSVRNKDYSGLCYEHWVGTCSYYPTAFCTWISLLPLMP